jgi:hypothetical protein
MADDADDVASGFGTATTQHEHQKRASEATHGHPSVLEGVKYVHGNY